MATLDNRDCQTAVPPILTERKAETCPLCGAFDRTLSWQCLNCGWCRAFSEGDIRDGLSRLRFQVKIPPIPLWWQYLKTWFHIDRR